MLKKIIFTLEIFTIGLYLLILFLNLLIKLRFFFDSSGIIESFFSWPAFIDITNKKIGYLWLFIVTFIQLTIPILGFIFLRKYFIVHIIFIIILLIISLITYYVSRQIIV